MSALELVAYLAAHVAGSSTRVVLARRAAEALNDAFHLVELELGWWVATDPDRATFVSAHRTRSGSFDLGEGTRAMRPGAVMNAVTHGEPVVVATSRSGLDPRLRGKVVVAVPLHPAVPVGYLLLGLDRAPEGELAAPAAQRALAATLLAPLLGCDTIARVSAVSRRAHVENRVLKAELGDRSTEGELVTRSPAMRLALERLDLVAPHPTAVLLAGESGTGKGVLARRLHDRSPRASGPFVAVNCGAIPEGLVDSELFGHEAGAFTGALKRHAGRFERARGGTLLLDEIGELPLGTQARLLRVLQDGEFEPVGSDETLRADVRVVAATHRPLPVMVAEGRFREDLYYRLDVFRIALPPLRGRVEDLPELAVALVRRASARLRLPPLPIEPEAMLRLLGHPWPGNVRELENLLERARLLATGRAIDGATLDAAGLGGPPVLHPLVEAAPLPQPWMGSPPVGTFDDEVRALLRRALSETRGKLYGEGGAAARLGLKPTTLQTKLRALGVDRKDFDPRKR